MTESGVQLPDGWRLLKLKDVAKLRNGYAFKTSEWSTTGRPIIRIQNLKSSSAAFNYFTGELPAQFRASTGDLLFAWSGTPGTSFGAHIWHGPEAWINQHIFRVDYSRNHFDRDFLKLALDFNLETYISEAQGGVGLAHITKSKLDESLLIAPPLEQQREIVAAVSALTYKRRSTLDHFVNAQRSIERFRQAVLAAACSGRLTADWREDHASELLAAEHSLEACRAERRQLLGRKATFPELLNTSDLPTLPSRWSWQTLGDVTLRIGDVDHKMPKAQPNGIPYISTKDFTLSGISFDNAKLISKHDFDLLSRKIAPEEGDILISRYGTVGEVRRVTTPTQFQASYSVAIVKTCKSVDLGPWLTLALRSPISKQFMIDHIRASSQPDLGLQHIRVIPVPIAPLAEQVEIVHRVENLLMLAESLLRRVEGAAKRVDYSDRAILAKACRGELTPTKAEVEAAEVTTK